MKTTVPVLAVVLGAFWGQMARAQDLDPAAYRSWVIQQRHEAGIDRLYTPYYQGYRGPNMIRGIPAERPLAVQSQDYYRGPGGEIVPYRSLPRNSVSKGYRYLGNYSSVHPRHAK